MRLELCTRKSYWVSGNKHTGQKHNTRDIHPTHGTDIQKMGLTLSHGTDTNTLGLTPTHGTDTNTWDRHHHPGQTPNTLGLTTAHRTNTITRD
jgi:hypothetical protein